MVSAADCDDILCQETGQEWTVTLQNMTTLQTQDKDAIKIELIEKKKTLILSSLNA